MPNTAGVLYPLEVEELTAESSWLLEWEVADDSSGSSVTRRVMGEILDIEPDIRVRELSTGNTVHVPVSATITGFPVQEAENDFGWESVAWPD